MYDSWNYLNNTQHYQNTPLVSIQHMSTVAYSFLKYSYVIYLCTSWSRSLSLYIQTSPTSYTTWSQILFSKKKKYSYIIYNMNSVSHSVFKHLQYYIQHELKVSSIYIYKTWSQSLTLYSIYSYIIHNPILKSLSPYPQPFHPSVLLFPKKTLFKCRPIINKDHNANTEIIQEIEKQQPQQLNTTRKQLRCQEKYQIFTL